MNTYQFVIYTNCSQCSLYWISKYV